MVSDAPAAALAEPARPLRDGSWSSWSSCWRSSPDVVAPYDPTEMKVIDALKGPSARTRSGPTASAGTC